MIQEKAFEFTYQDLLELHASAQREGLGSGYELEEGEPILMVALDPSQGRIQLELAGQLRNHVREHDLGQLFIDTFLDFGRQRWYYPDITFLSNDDLLRYDGRRLPVPPTLLIEVSIASSEQRDAVRKRQVYERAGVPWYWILNLVDETIREYRLAEGAYEEVRRVGLYQAFTPSLFPGLAIQLEPYIPRQAPP